MREIEQDGFITDEIYIKETPPKKPKAIEWVAMDKAREAEPCKYPKCEECSKYIASHCTVPIVVTKQMLCMYETFHKTVMHEMKDIWEVLWDMHEGAPKKTESDPERELYDKTLVEIAEENHEVLDV